MTDLDARDIVGRIYVRDLVLVSVIPASIRLTPTSHKTGG